MKQEVSEAVRELRKDVRKRLHDMSQPAMFLSGCITMAQMDGTMARANLEKAEVAINRLMTAILNLQVDLNKGELE